MQVSDEMFQRAKYAFMDALSLSFYNVEGWIEPALRAALNAALQREVAPDPFRKLTFTKAIGTKDDWVAKDLLGGSYYIVSLGDGQYVWGQRFGSLELAMAAAQEHFQETVRQMFFRRQPENVDGPVNGDWK